MPNIQLHEIDFNTPVSIGPHAADFIAGQIKGGRYVNANDVVAAGLKLLEEHETRIKALQDALHAGINSGEPQPFDNEAFLKRMHAQHG